ncbi:MAG TPA: hypothetical protein VGB77_18020 [Abditibacteriaceae bacterium]|jgi:hypothetical protein
MGIVELIIGALILIAVIGVFFTLFFGATRVGRSPDEKSTETQITTPPDPATQQQLQGRDQ